MVVDRAADADVYRVVRHEQVFLERAPEDRAVRDGRAEIGVPGVQVRVEMDEGDRAMRTYDRAEHGQRHGVVPADGDDRVPPPTSSQACAWICATAMSIEKGVTATPASATWIALNGAQSSST